MIPKPTSATFLYFSLKKKKIDRYDRRMAGMTGITGMTFATTIIPWSQNIRKYEDPEGRPGQAGPVQFSRKPFTSEHLDAVCIFRDLAKLSMLQACKPAIN